MAFEGVVDCIWAHHHFQDFVISPIEVFQAHKFGNVGIGNIVLQEFVRVVVDEIRCSDWGENLKLARIAIQKCSRSFSVWATEATPVVRT